MAKLYMLIGIPASGKSTVADKLKKSGAKVHSSDSIREELFNDTNIQTDNDLVFRMLHNRIKTDLGKGHDVVYDATNINRKKRMAFLREIERMNVTKIAILLATPYEQVLINNKKRVRSVPEHVIEKMYKAFYIPQYFEGWNKIVILYYKNVDEKIKSKYMFNQSHYAKLNNFDQENKHHSLSLGKHMTDTSIYVARAKNKMMKEIVSLDGFPSMELFEKAKQTIPSLNIIFASSMHDYGKLKTKSFFNGKREAVDSATYYGHENVGAYDILFFLEYRGGERFHQDTILEIVFYIQYHMMPFHWQGNSEKEKFKKMVGEVRFNGIMMIHEADKLAH